MTGLSSMQEKTVRLIIRSEIQDNDLYLLSSFGLVGITSSWFKENTILKILSRFDEDKEWLVNIFFDELEAAYLEDSQFDVYTYEEVENLIKEEKLFILGRFI